MSTAPNDGGAAYPRPTYVECDPSRDNQGHISGDAGMSLRDYFAAQTLPGLTSDSKYRDVANDAERIAEVAYHLADAMIAERAKATGGQP